MCGEEDSFTKLSNKLFDALQRFHCSELKKEIMMNLIRNTSGYHRESVLTTASAIASFICRSKAKTIKALHELIECNIVIADSKEGPGRTRRLRVNYDIMQWRHNALQKDAEGYETNRKCSTGEPENEEVSSKESLSKQYREVSSERAQMDTPYSDSGSIKESHPVSFESAQMGYTPKHAYIDGKNEKSGPKENIKEKERNIYMYDITLIPKTLSEMPGFKKAFNDWCTYKQQVQRPLTAIGIEIDMRKLLLFNSEGYNVISIIENAITTGWLDLYRPGSRQESPAKQVEYRSVKGIENESY